jgi:hypothetical protein
MKKMVLSAVLVMGCLFVLQSARAISNTSSVVVPVSTPALTPVVPDNDKLVQEFLKLTPKKYQEMTGQKMSMAQKISLKLAQKKIKRMLKQGKTVDLVAMSKKGIDTSDFNIGGFLLGIFLFLIGVLIAYLIGGDDLIKWAWLGAGLVAVIWLLVLLV